MEPEKIEEPEDLANTWETYNSRDSILEWEKTWFDNSDNIELGQLSKRKRGRPRKIKPPVRIKKAEKITNTDTLYQKLRRLLPDDQYN